ncbi:MAG TPA: phosphoglycerate dehydrogenase [Alphaproteobacteria bacterium]|nr:phosphoglycerate dehydrogenase [Alphaproteobacteria bacterium]
MTAFPKRAAVTTAPFGALDPAPLELAAAAGVALTLNPYGRRLQAHEVAGFLKDHPVVIAGTEPLNEAVMDACPGLKAICRVGVGLDSVDLSAARRRGIAVSYTPDAPSTAVAELAVGLILDLLRGVAPADRALRQGEWTRTTGARIARSTVGVLGVGRIGRRVIHHLLGGFPGVRVLAHDLNPDLSLDGVEWVDKETIYRTADVVTVHLPLTAATKDLIGARELAAMRPSAVLVNTARGGIVNERDLAAALAQGVIQAAAIDVFEHEPYKGPLAQSPRTLLTCHMGSMTADCRAQMETEAMREAIRFLAGEPFASPVPDEEYAIAEQLHRA